MKHLYVNDLWEGKLCFNKLSLNIGTCLPVLAIPRLSAIATFHTINKALFHTTNNPP